MRISRLFGKTSKSAPHDADSPNARLLAQAGFVRQLAAGIYTYLPFGLRVLRKIQNIVREEMNALGAEEILMPALHPKEIWDKTGRWTDPGHEVMFQFEGHGGKEFGLGWTHEEVVTPLAKSFISSYRDLPVAVYQIQDKFRNEPRAKSGLLRGREFSMKDLYSFHADEDDLNRFYEAAKSAYLKIFERCGLHALVAEASGGAFSKYSHEFQVLNPYGEDTIFYCPSCEYAQNREIAEIKSGARCAKCGKGKVKESRAIEVGNIFRLKTRFSEPFNLSFIDESGEKRFALMGCYGIGPSRVMGAVVEAHHDERGIVWPKEVAPYSVHLLALPAKDPEQKEKIWSTAESIYDELVSQEGIEALFDDRENVSAGEKFADADLIGIPLRLVVSERSLRDGGIEVKLRKDAKASVIKLQNLHDELISYL